MVNLENTSILLRDAQDELRAPLPQKHTDGRIVYLSRNAYGQPSVPTGTVQIVDFDRSVFGTLPHFGCIQADVYRAPEVINDAGYGYSADIWSLGVMLWDLLEGKKLFDVLSAEHTDEYDEHLHLAYITALLGPQPKALATGRRSAIFFDDNGLLRKQTSIPDQFDFENSICSMAGVEKQMLIKFLKKMITWCPQERSSAKELLSDPWLHDEYAQSEVG